MSVSSYLFLTWKPNTHRKGPVAFSGNSHQIHHYFINTFLFLCQNWLGLVTLHFSFHWLPFIQMWMQETGGTLSLWEFNWVQDCIFICTFPLYYMLNYKKDVTECDIVLWPLRSKSMCDCGLKMNLHPLTLSFTVLPHLVLASDSRNRLWKSYIIMQNSTNVP